MRLGDINNPAHIDRVETKVFRNNGYHGVFAYFGILRENAYSGHFEHLPALQRILGGCERGFART